MTPFLIESSGRDLTIAFLGAGLLEIHETLLSGTHATFLNRCEKYELELLGHADASEALPLRGAPLPAHGGATQRRGGIDSVPRRRDGAAEGAAA